MNNKISVKRIICLLLAVIMLFATAGCKGNKPKKKVVIRNKIVVTPEVEDNTSSDDTNTSSDIDINIDNNSSINSDVSSEEEIVDDQESQPQEEVESEDEETTSRPKRVLINAADNVEEETIPFDEIHKETFAPEFESESVKWDGPKGYVIVYSPAADKNGAPTNARVLAEKLKTFFKDNDNVDLPVYKDTDPALEGVTKMIIVGDTAYYKSSLKETEFAVNLKGDKLVFEGGHTVMAEKAVDWFRTIKREKGKVATLYGVQDDFVSTKTIDGKKYVYVWGDEFDGEELCDESKWHLGDHMPENPDVEFVHTEQFSYVENGRLRLTADRYLSETSEVYGWAHTGSYDTETSMAFKNGYFEYTAKVSYTQGILPPVWLMSNPQAAASIPVEQYTAPWTVEIDIFETFSNGNQWDVSIHKYYTNYDKVIDGVRYSNGVVFQEFDSDGNKIDRVLFNGEEVYSQAGLGTTNKLLILTEGRYAAWGTITSWRDHYKKENPEEDKKQRYIFEGEALEKLNDTYHTYGYLHTKDGYKVYLDGECWLEREWDTGFDGVDGFDFNNNNGWGYELYYYLIMNQYIYSAQSTLGDWAKIKDNKTLPISSWYDNVRLYQIADEIAISTPPYNE